MNGSIRRPGSVKEIKAIKFTQFTDNRPRTTPSPANRTINRGPPQSKSKHRYYLKKSTTLYGLKREIYNEICFSTELAKMYAKYSVRRLIN